MNSHVVITEAPQINYRIDYVALPKNYGSAEYYKRDDVKAIIETVYKNLNDLNERTGFADDLVKYKQILIKPNLVSVYHSAGLADTDYPESTDPRVFDAVVSYVHQYTTRISIIESSGKPMPTSTSFKVSGIDRIAKRYGAALYALETLPVVRYLLPKAEVMKEVYIPDILQDVVKGEAYYISVPKLKTNLYTGVTLGFKNAMGTIPYFLRERNHTYRINKKLADLLYLFQPNLVVIDGIIGGEGNTPAPVDPVDVGVIISGNHAVEVDRVATRVMGIYPDEIMLMKEAFDRGFKDPGVTVTGKIKVVPFRRAISSLMDENFVNRYPNVLALAGHILPHAPKIPDVNAVTPEIARQLEMACDGGCLAALRSGFDYIHYSPKPKYDFPLIVIIGEGVLFEGKRYWFDREGTPYSDDEIRSLSQPKLTLGNCAQGMNDCAKFKAPGCCDPSKCMLAATAAGGVTFPLLTMQNKALSHFVLSLLGTVLKRSFWIMRGRWVDCYREHIDKIYEIPELSDEDKVKDFIEWPLPKMTIAIKVKCIKDQFTLLQL